MYIGHLHRSQCMAEISFQPKWNSRTSMMVNSETKVEALEIPAKMHFESYAPGRISAEDNGSARNEQSDTSHKMGTKGSQQRFVLESSKI